MMWAWRRHKVIFTKDLSVNYLISEVFLSSSWGLKIPNYCQWRALGGLKDLWGGLLRTPKVIIIVQNHCHISSISSQSLWLGGLGGCNFLTDNAILMPFDIRNLQKVCDVVYFMIQSKICNICWFICTIRFYYKDCSGVQGTCKHVWN